MPSTISAGFSSIQDLNIINNNINNNNINLSLDMEERATQDIVSLSFSTEDRDRKIFMGDINKFMAEIGKPLSKIPIMGYKELDLFQLFKEVTAYGGFTEVVKNVGTWSKIWKRLGNFDPSITDSSFRLKKNYERYLLDYEYKCFPENKIQAQEMEKQIQNRNDSAPKKLKGDSSKEKQSKAKKNKRKNLSSTFKEIERDADGSPKMPLPLGELTVDCLGKIIPNSPYITEKHIWPIGFRSYRYFSSMVNPDVRVKYTSQIIDGGDKPQFMVTAEDDANNAIISYSPSGAWRTVLKRVMVKTGNDEARKNISVSGTLRFGLAHPIVSHLIKELPGADKCKDLGGSWSSSPSNSPSIRKRKSDEDLSSEEDLEEMTKKPRRQDEEDEDFSASENDSYFSSRGVSFSSRQEIDDLESAVATLQALKYCAVY
jgi:hypothetical protein